jgi:hypothetical protein
MLLVRISHDNIDLYKLSDMETINSKTSNIVDYKIINLRKTKNDMICDI